MTAVIEDLRVICQGTPIEEMYDYNLMFATFIDLRGYIHEEFNLYMETHGEPLYAPAYLT